MPEIEELTEKDLQNEIANFGNEPIKGEIAPEKDNATAPVIDNSEQNQQNTDNEIVTQQADKGTSDGNNFIITQEYLDKHPEFPSLSRFIGKPFDEVVKSYFNLEREFSKRQVQPTQPAEVKPVENDNTPQINIETVKNELFIKTMKSKFPDYPDTEDEMNDLAIVNPRRFYEILNSEKGIKEEVAKDVETLQDWTTNFNEYNWDNAKSQLTEIESEIKKWGVTPEELGIKLDDDLVVELCNDPSVFRNTFGKPELKENALVSKFRNDYYDKLRLSVIEKTRAEGFRAATDKNVSPSISNATIQPKNTMSLKPNNPESMSDDDLQAQIKKLQTTKF